MDPEDKSGTGGRIRWVFGKGRGVGSCNEDQNCRPLLPCHFKQQTPGASKLALLSRLALHVRTAAGDCAVLAILNASHNPIGPFMSVLGSSVGVVQQFAFPKCAKNNTS
jgi:hypothetical protein